MNAKFFSLNILAVGAMWLAAPLAHSAAISLQPSSASFVVGEHFSVDVFADAVGVDDSLLAFGFDVLTDSGFSFLGATVAAPFFDDSLFFPNTSVAGSAFPSVSGDSVHLATLQFQAGTTAGLFALTLATDAGNYGFSEGLFTEFGVIDVSSSLAVNVTALPSTPTAVPEPGAMSLLIAGLVGVAITGSRRRLLCSGTGDDAVDRVASSS